MLLTPLSVEGMALKYFYSHIDLLVEYFPSYLNGSIVGL